MPQNPQQFGDFIQTENHMMQFYADKINFESANATPTVFPEFVGCKLRHNANTLFT